ncbi:MAG TPA: PQQ-binding-like beta-propeller repeat protein [Chthonomonadales bacterium]|nr:PQQ-binding-like beta-propeller repeat protein [Chthonomonadales bacterium]
MRSLTLALATLSLATVALADWPRWRGADQTARIPAGQPLPRQLPAQPRLVWAIPVGEGHAAPVVSGGAVYYLDARDGMETAYRVDAATGREVWRVQIDRLFTDYHSPPGPRAAPVVDGDRVYVQSCLGELKCLDAATGRVLWRVNYVRDFGAPVPAEAGNAAGSSRHGYSGPPVIDGNRIIVTAGGPGASLVCMDKRTGRVIWRSQNDAPGHLGPVVATLGGVRQVIAFTAEGLIGVALSDGALLWREPIRTRFGRHAMTPLVVGDVVVAGSWTAGLTGVRVTRADGRVRAERAWHIPTLGVNFSSPVAIGRMVYGLGPGNRLFCVDASTGRQVWVADRFFSGTVSTDWAAFMVAGNDLLIHTDSGQLLHVAVNEQGPTLRGQATVSGRNWCHPAYSGGRLFVRDGRELRCLELVPRQ